MAKKKKHALIPPPPMGYQEVGLSALQLDDKNPRFGGLTENQSEAAIIDKLATEKNLLELIESFRQNGYYRAEPLLVVETKKGSGKYVVIEGNRRVAALKILFNAELLKKYGFSRTALAPTGAIADELKNRIPVQIYNNRHDLWSYLGFRHIKGPMEWDPYSKALYIVGLYEDGLPIAEIVERIGDQNALVTKMFNGIRVLKQAEDEGYINPNEMQKFAFSHLYTILGYTNARKFLGLKLKEGDLLKKNPVKSSYLPNLEELINFIYGDIKGKTKSVVRSQNPDIRRLAAVLGHSKTVAELKENVNQPGALENIFNSTSEAEEVVSDMIADALAKLKKALGNLASFKDKDGKATLLLKEIVQVADFISGSLTKANGKAKKKNTKKRS
jgi:hypothetical protein